MRSESNIEKVLSVQYSPDIEHVIMRPDLVRDLCLIIIGEINITL